MSLEAYSVAVRLKLVDMVTPALGVISMGMRSLSRDASAAQGHVAELEKRLHGIKQLGLVGGAMAAAGGFGLSLFEAPLKAAREYELAFTKFKTLNLGDAVNKQADQFARSAGLMGISAKELMNTMSESVGIFGNYAEAQKMAPKIAALNAANSAIFQGKVGHIDEGSARSLIKFIDRRGGAKDDDTFMRNLDLAQKMVTGSGGFIKFRDLDQFSQQGGTAFRGLSDAGILNMALLLQEQGGSRAGTALMSTYQNLIAGRSTKAAAHTVVDVGLGKMIEQAIGTVGGRTQTRSHLVLNSDFATALQADPVAAIRDFVVPAIARKYGGDDQTELKYINDMLSNRTASGQASIIGTQLLQVMRDANLAKNAMGYDATIKAYKDDPNSKFADLTARWQDTLRELGLVVLPAAIKGVEGLTGILRGIENFARTAPDLTKGILLLGATLSGLAAVGGAVMLATAGFRALGLAMVVGKGVGLGAKMIELSGALGKAGLAGAAVLAIGAIGTLIYSLKQLWDISNREGVKLTPDAQSTLSNPTLQAQLAAMDADFELRRSGRAAPTVRTGPSDFMADRQARTANNSLVLNMDGRKVGEIVSGHQARAASRPQTGATSFDARLALGPAGGY